MGIVAESEFSGGSYDELFGEHLREYWAFVVWGLFFVGLLTIIASIIQIKYFNE